MQMNSTDAVVVRFVEATKELEEAAAAAVEYLEKATDPQTYGKPTPLRRLVIKSLGEASQATGIARRNFRYGHDCDAGKCDSDSHK